jgi:hypothetical protein
MLIPGWEWASEPLGGHLVLLTLGPGALANAKSHKYKARSDSGRPPFALIVTRVDDFNVVVAIKIGKRGIR